ncbi:DNA alkylation repair protein [Paenibacillus sp. HJGM_3]|uniref:DNA alkylation repair protein n=1 Tax=Paenibacillus sp. HJGM_3 TaxID=3379816 RepID=UPI00385FA314
MAEPLKSIYSPAFLHSFAHIVRNRYSGFNQEAFVAKVMEDGWEELELKARIRRISTVLGSSLPERYEDAIDVLLSICEECSGFPYLFFPDFVEVYGTREEHWELSMKALERFTCFSSAEFAIREFIVRDPDRAMKQMLVWSRHENEHVRRLASEGCRPRLPWGKVLQMLKKDPSPILPILEQLKADPSLYVRKSVANNLNDIAKDHPSIVIETARRWLGKQAETDWIVRHACRTLIRKADPDVLALFGYEEENDTMALVTGARIVSEPSTISIGERCDLRYELTIREGDPKRFRVEYGIYFVKAGGNTSRKLFLLTDKIMEGGFQLSGSRSHNWSDLSTRRHYSGTHRIVLVVNGQEVAETEIELVKA